LWGAIVIRPGTLAQAFDLLRRDRIVDEGDGWPHKTLEALERLATSRHRFDREHPEFPTSISMAWRYPRGAVDGVRWFSPI
jgi:hypothetical protein